MDKQFEYKGYVGKIYHKFATINVKQQEDLYGVTKFRFDDWGLAIL